MQKAVNIGVLGCGAIGTGIAQSTLKELKGLCRISALFDIDTKKTEALQKKLGKTSIVKRTFTQLLKSCDLMVEAVNAYNTRPFIRQALTSGKDVLAMSSGKLLNARPLFSLARKNKCSLIIPSGAIAGIDALKAASLVHIDQITLTTRKPVSGFKNNPFVEAKGIDLSKLDRETVLFEGSVDEAVRHFPQNINVAATLALAGGVKSKLKIRIITSPDIHCNSHEVEVIGDFGRMISRTENTICPDNPKTSYLAVLSAIQALKQHCLNTRIGT